MWGFVLDFTLISSVSWVSHFMGLCLRMEFTDVPREGGRAGEERSGAVGTAVLPLLRQARPG